MDDSARNLVWAAGAGALAGTLGWVLVKPLVASAMEAELRRQIEAQLTTQLDAKLAQYGITPQTMQQIAQMVTTVGRSWILG